MKPKHFIIILLALLTSITVSAETWTDANGTEWYFTTSGSNATITYRGYNNGNIPSISGNIPANLTVPSKVYISETAYNVTSIGDCAFSGCSSLTSIIIPDGVTSIGMSAFEYCSSLTSINIPDGLTSIGQHAFSNCSSLATINIPDGVTSIGLYAFLLCTSLSSIHFASATPKVTFAWNGTTTLFVPDAAVDDYKAAWTDYVSQIVPESKSEYVYDVTVTANENSSAVIEEIGDEDALNVVNLKVRGTFNSYDVMVFRNKMKNLRNLDLSDANVVASSYAYYDTYKTKDNIVTGYFAPASVVSFKLPKDITALEAYAFRYCQYLKALTLPEGITEIPNGAFSSCESLTSINIPESVTSIGGSTFYDCKKIQSIHLPEQLKTIGIYAFQGCYSLTEIHLPPYLTSIYNNAFMDCYGLKSIYAYMPDIISIGTNTFNDYAHQQLYVPEFLYNNYYYDTNWSQFLNVIPTELEPDDYKSLSIQTSDVGVNEDGTAIPAQSNGDAVDVEVGLQGSFTAGEDLSQTAEDAQYFNHADLVLDGEGHGGSLIGEDNGSTAGNLRVNTLRVKINVKAGRWYFFCFPYDVTIANCTYPGQYAWRWYDGAERAANGSGGWKAVAGSTLTAGQGYAFQTSHTGNMIVEFSNPKFGGNRPKTLVAHASANAANASWNLVGNPYSSFYDFLTVDFDAPITVYNSNGTYSAYRPADDECHLQPYEAFFVQKPTEVDEINFEPERRESYNQGQTKKAASVKARLRAGITPERRLINLEMFCGDEQADRTRVVLNEKKSRDYELDCDASKFLSNEAKAQLYSIENGVQMAINERPQQGDIRLGYTAAKAGTLSISASRMDMPMVLVDTQLGTTFDLSLGSYDFDTQAGTFNERFVLRLSGEATAINDITKKTGVCIGTQDGGIAIGGAEGKTVNVYTTGGAQAAQHNGNGFVALSRGVYVVSVDGVTAKVSVK